MGESIDGRAPPLKEPAVPRPLTPTEQDYSDRLFKTLLDAIIELNAEPGANQGTVMPDIVRVTLADLAATIDHNCGVVNSGNERRRNSEVIAKRYSTALKELENMPGKEMWLQALRMQ